MTVDGSSSSNINPISVKELEKVIINLVIIRDRGKSLGF